MSTTERPTNTPFIKTTDNRVHLLNPQWKIAGVLPAIGTTIVSAEPKTGKSMMAMAIGAHLASGRDAFAERLIHHDGDSVVIHLDPEGSQPSAAARMLALFIEHGFNEEEQHAVVHNYRHIVRSPRTFGPDLFEWLEAMNNIQKLGMIVIDGVAAMVAQTGAAIDENNNSQMAAVMVDLNELSDRIDVPIWLNHHTPKRQPGSSTARLTARGASSIEGGAAAIGYLTGGDNGDRAFHIKALRHAAAIPGELAFDISSVELGRDRNGQVVTGGVATNLQWRERTQTKPVNRVAEIVSFLHVTGKPQPTAAVAESLGMKTRIFSNWKSTAVDDIYDAGIRISRKGTRDIWYLDANNQVPASSSSP